jgi:hypothetical protein
MKEKFLDVWEQGILIIFRHYYGVTEENTNRFILDNNSGPGIEIQYVPNTNQTLGYIGVKLLPHLQ